MHESPLIHFFTQFASLEEEQATLLLRYWKPLKLKKNDYFLRRGQRCSRMAFIENGIMRTGTVNEKGEEYTCSFALRNYVITDLEAYYRREITNSDIQCMTDCELRVLTYDDEQLLLHEFADWTMIREKVTVHMMQLFLNIHAVLVHQNATERYQKFAEQYPEVISEVQLGYIASYLGIAQPSLSRIRKSAGA